MFTRVRMAVLAAESTVAKVGAVARSAHAGPLSLATGSRGAQEYRPFTQRGDSNYHRRIDDVYPDPFHRC